MKIIFKNTTSISITAILALCFVVTVNAQSPWSLDLNFNVGAIGAQVTEFSDAAGNTVYDNTVTYNGQSAKMEITEGSDGWGGWGGRKLFPSELGEGDELWIQLRTFFPSSFDFNTNLAFLKFLRVTVKEDDGTHIGNHDLMIRNDQSYFHLNELGNTATRMEVFPDEYGYAQNMIIGEIIIGQTSGASATVIGLKPTGYNFDYNSASPAFSQFETIVGQASGENRTRMRYISTHNNTIFGANHPVQTDVWETIVYRLRFSATNPLLQFYKHVGETGFDAAGKPVGGSMQLIYEDRIDKTLKTSTDKAWAFLIFTYWNGGAPQTQSMYIDDLIISTEPPSGLILDLIFSNGFDNN